MSDIMDFHRSFVGVTGEDEVKTAGGVILPGWGGKERSWVKVAGEPAQIMVETPVEFVERWRAWQARIEVWTSGGKVGMPPVLVCHEFTYGQAMFFFPGMELAYVGVTYPTHTQSQTKPGSVWAGLCRCGDLGGPCPKSDDA